MASPNPSYSSNYSKAVWTVEENKLFETALAIYDEDSPDRWHNVAKAVGGKTVEEIKMQYNLLLKDIALIEADNFPLPQYKSLDDQQSSQVMTSLTRKEQWLASGGGNRKN